jgi:serine protease
MKKEYFVVLVVLASFLILGIAGVSFGQDFLVKSEVKASDGPKWVPGEIIVKFKSGVSEKVLAGINSRHGSSVISTSRFAGFKRLRIPGRKTVAEMVEIYKKNPNVEYAEPNFLAHAFGMVPNDPGYQYQWHLQKINMEKAWDISTGTPDVIVAVIDTGVAYEDYEVLVDNPGRGQDYTITYIQAPDLADTNFVAGYDFVNDDPHPNDDEGHGTHVTGTIAQSTNNKNDDGDFVGVAGIAYDTSVMPIKVLDNTGSGTYAGIADGIYFAADNGADIINMSLGGASGSDTLEDALEYAYNTMGVTIICASGNDGSATTVSYPAAYDAYCIAVGATDFNEEVAYYSNGGGSLDLTAPGGDTNVDLNGDGCVDGVLQQTFGDNPADMGFYFYQGTSMAAPHVSGVAALLIAANLDITPDEIREALQSTAKDKGATGWDLAYGWGIVDAEAALIYSINNITPNDPPVAVAIPSSEVSYFGTEDSPLAFNGSASYDPDGDSLTYQWDFGDGSTGSGIKPTHTYAAGGDYTVSLVVNDGKVDSPVSTTTADIEEINDFPVADAGMDQTALAGVPVNFDGSNSYDPDEFGSIISYEWDFGDGSSIVTGVSPSHTYSSVGEYPVTLIVTDDGSFSDTDMAIVTVTDELTSFMHIVDIEMSIKRAGSNVNAIATIFIIADSGIPVGGVTVSGHWDGLTADNDSGITDENGAISFSSDKLKNANETFTFNVDSLTKDGWTYEVSADFEQSDSITP